jgi:hypothetical protein
MSIDHRHLVTGSLLAFVAVTAATLGVKEIRHARAVASAEVALPVRHVPRTVAPPAALQPADQTATIYVTYFRATARCMSCLKIEDLTDGTMTTRFAGPIADKRVVWRTLNVDEPENHHFVKDYGLYTKSVVVSEVRNGREVRWKNLDQVWQLLGDPPAFQSYVEREVQAFLEKT